MEVVQQYNYLGSALSQDGKLDHEILNRVQKSMNAYYALSQTIFGKKEIDKKTKCRLYNTVVEPILLYGSESWAAQEKHLSKVNAVQMKVLRRISGKTKYDRVRNEKIRNELDETSVSQKVAGKQLKWYGHVNRMEKSRKPKQYLHARPEGKRLRGRQRFKYIDAIEQHGRKKGKTLREMESLTKDRKAWRAFASTHPTP